MADLAIWEIMSDSTLEACPVPVRRISGIDELTQRVLIEFLTPRGSVKADPEAGTSFLYVLSQDTPTTFWIQHAFGIAESQIRRRMMELETDDDADDCRYLNTTLDSVSVSGNTITVQISVYNRKGASKTVIFDIEE